MIKVRESDLLARLEKAQQDDFDVKRIFDLVKTQKVDGYVIRGNVLFKEASDDLRVVSASLRCQVIRRAHERGHFLIIFGNPRRIISDRGIAFTSHDFQNYCKDESIEHALITTGVPRTNGQAKRGPWETSTAVDYIKSWANNVEDSSDNEEPENFQD